MVGFLSELINSSTGGPAASGKSFRNHVNNAASAVGMAAYKVISWLLSGIPDTSDHAHNSSFHITISFTQNDHAQYIKQTGNSINVNRTLGGSTGTDVRKDGSSVVAGATGSYLDITLLGGISNTGNVAIPANTPWFGGYVYPNDPGGGGAATVVWESYLNNPNGGGVPNPLEFNVSYIPDVGQFNPILSDHIVTSVISRAETIADYEIQWGNVADYSSIHTIGQSFGTTTTPGETKTFYLRYRPIGAVGWTDLGAVSFTDPR